jgi:hypothetical protein
MHENGKTDNNIIIIYYIFNRDSVKRPSFYATLHATYLKKTPLHIIVFFNDKLSR